ncbi:polyprenyl synthetase family protein [Saccharothrix sp. NPDC042600]|uniref:polyprenyl synthetase family protein n=1 Tax=Saccharothrix TaxID=2071 RepID=UPI0033E22A81|nr:polyprenyl synthetase family protein [Saccharothrix mutabilis subsp. capreolus]
MTLATGHDTDATASSTADLAPRLADELDRYLRDRCATGVAAEISAALADFVRRGGKRLRPTFAWWGWRAGGGAPDGPAADTAVRAFVALELLQACALVHDDVMDRSATRRGRPATHRAFAAKHRRSCWAGDSAGYGDAAAILVGDLALAWADDALVTAGLPADGLARAWTPWQAMRTEMIAGQHLDLLAVARREESLEETLRVARYKTAAYTVERPLHLGAALADAEPAVLSALRVFGHDIGVAYQLRDDLLGVFGDPEVTGKPVDDDLREGKRTPLISVGLSLARERRRDDVTRLLRRCLDDRRTDPRTLAAVADALREIGAVAALEQQIAALTASGLRALDHPGVDPDARRALTALAARATSRLR